ncbi:MAG: phosphatidylglycerophosphatase A [Deltaproteobacteria bacterium]|nr:phosphatidylglycerophosphatase A [Deltaproteobacteria bacterium]
MNSNNKPALKGLILFLSSGTYLGYIPLASGTFGTLWGLPIFYWLSARPIWFQIVFTVGSIFLAVFLAGQAEKIWNKKDPSQVVIDEIVGYMAAVVWMPFSWEIALAAFFIFRAMDIFKPYPIRKIDQNLPGGWGIVLDDVLAGIYTHLLLRLWIYFRP